MLLRRLRLIALAPLPALALAPLLALAPSPAFASAPNGQTLDVVFELRAAGNDAIDVCQELAFGKDAVKVGHAVARALNLPLARVSYDPETSPECFGLRFAGRAVTRRGPGHSREFVLDGDDLARAAGTLGYGDLIVEVCVPFVRATPSGTNDMFPSQDCEYKGFAFEGFPRVRLSVRFAPDDTDTSRGFGAVCVWLLSFATIGAGAWTTWGRAWHWRFFRRHRVLTGFATVPLIFGAGILWMLVTIRSGFFHAVDMLAGMGPPGEIAIGILGWLVSIAGIVAIVIRVGHEARRAFPDPVPAPLAFGDRPPPLPPLALLPPAPPRPLEETPPALPPS